MDGNPYSSAVSDIPIPGSTADRENVSSRKLLNTSFEKLESSRGILTRQQANEGMKTSTKATQHHMVKNDKLTLKKQYQYCPKSADTWCKYRKDKTDKTSVYNEDNRLPEVFMQQLDPIFTRLPKDDLLNRCLKGMTQNQNEAANGMLWSRLSFVVQDESALLHAKLSQFSTLVLQAKQWS